ncbi:MAG: hypothetical protein K5879_03915 [Lachnospiraceae bacterium]|nr:hypothetical protein [Lachnospiraceae bacterium]
MNRNELFAILETEPTDDAGQIKRAYAKMTSKVHPEENPKEWEKIHNAYEELMKDARGKQNRGRKTAGLANPVKTTAVNGAEGKGSSAGREKNAENLDREIDRLVKDSFEYESRKEQLKQVSKILKNVPSVKASFYGYLGVNESEVKELISREDFTNALSYPEFRTQLELVLEECFYPGRIADEILEKIPEGSAEYDALKEILLKKKERAKELSKSHFKKKLYGDGFINWICRDHYNLRDYVGKRDLCRINQSTKTFAKKGFNRCRCELTLDGVNYPVFILHNINNTTNHMERLCSSAYETPEDALRACMEISEHYEKRWEKHKFLRFLRQFMIVLLDLSIAVSGVFALILMGFDVLHLGVIIVIFSVVADTVYKIATVMALETNNLR